MKEYKVLIVEDDTRLVEMLKLHFGKQGWTNSSASTITEAISSFQLEIPDLVILDRNLPDGDGLEVCIAIRQMSQHTRILMLTGYDEELDVVSALENGADDYVGKPFRLAELMARMKNLLRRLDVDNCNSSDSIDASDDIDLLIKVSSREVLKKGSPIHLTAKEFDLLLFFANNPGRVFTRSQLLFNVWHSENDCYEQSINTTVKRLRRKIESDSVNPLYLETVRSVGYRFNADQLQLAL